METISEEGKTLAIMAHDIKAPLAAILDLLDVIRKGYVEDPEKVTELISRASHKAETLIDMVDDILDYTLLQNKSMMKREIVGLHEILEDSYSTMKPLSISQHITLEFNAGICQEMWINGNYTFLLRVFNNLIMNAIKYNRDKGSIILDCQEKPDKKAIVIKVRDTGIGIPEDELEKVFHIFERGRFARKNINGSLGLGLSLVKQIVEDHEGEIHIESTVGIGTTVFVTLPLYSLEKGGRHEL